MKCKAANFINSVFTVMELWSFSLSAPSMQKKHRPFIWTMTCKSTLGVQYGSALAVGEWMACRWCRWLYAWPLLFVLIIRIISHVALILTGNCLSGNIFIGHLLHVHGHHQLIVVFHKCSAVNNTMKPWLKQKLRNRQYYATDKTVRNMLVCPFGASTLWIT